MKDLKQTFMFKRGKNIGDGKGRQEKMQRDLCNSSVER
jgi:hypothetical protein